MLYENSLYFKAVIKTDDVVEAQKVVEAPITASPDKTVEVVKLVEPEAPIKQVEPEASIEQVEHSGSETETDDDRPLIENIVNAVREIPLIEIANAVREAVNQEEPEQIDEVNDDDLWTMIYRIQWKSTDEYGAANQRNAAGNINQLQQWYPYIDFEELIDFVKEKMILLHGIFDACEMDDIKNKATDQSFLSHIIGKGKETFNAVIQEPMFAIAFIGQDENFLEWLGDNPPVVNSDSEDEE